jgi:hypothetical protein
MSNEDIQEMKEDIRILREEMLLIRKELNMMKKAAMKVAGIFGGLYAVVQGGIQLFG